MKYIIIEDNLYILSDSDFTKIISAEACCFGSCNKESISELKETITYVLLNYEPICTKITWIGNLKEPDEPTDETDFDDVDDLPF